MGLLSGNKRCYKCIGMKDQFKAEYGIYGPKVLKIR